MVVGGPLPRGGRRPLLLRAAVALGLLAAPIAGQLCTVNEWNAATRPDDGCIDPGATPPLPQIDLWEYRCPIEGGEVGDFGAGDQLAVIESVPVCDPDNPVTGCRVYMGEGDTLVNGAAGTATTFCGTLQDAGAAIDTAAGCAAACDAQMLDRDHMRERDPASTNTGSCEDEGGGVAAGCKAFLWVAGVSCTLYSSKNESAITPGTGAQYYAKIDEGTAGSADGVSTAGPGTCGCPTAPIFTDRCVVGCEADTCAQVPVAPATWAQVFAAGGCQADTCVVLMKTGAGACRGGSPTDNADADITKHENIATPAACLALCTTADCYGVTIQAPEDGGTDECQTAEDTTCAPANINQNTCESAGDCTWDSGTNTCGTTPDPQCGAPTDRATCEGAGRCTFASGGGFTCEVWNKVQIENGARVSQKVTVAELNDGERYVPVRPRHQAGAGTSAAGKAQCWLPEHAVHVCEVPAGETAVTSAPRRDGIESIMAHCAEDDSETTTTAITPGPQTCLQCAAFYGPDPYRSDAVCNPKYGMARSTWFEAGDMRCKDECADNEEQLSECPMWASNDECNTNAAYMAVNCAYSCRSWTAGETAHCIEPMDPDEAVLRCTPCPSTYFEGEEYATRCNPGSALGTAADPNPHCESYGMTARTGHDADPYSPVMRVYVEGQGWRDIPLGFANADPYLNQCEDMMTGPNFGQLGVPVPPHSRGTTDRYTVECELLKSDCTSYHRSSRDNCAGENEYYLSLRLNFYMDCDAGAGEGCRASENHVLGGREGYPPKYCNRGSINPEDPPHGFHWSIPLCKTTNECIDAGAAVVATEDAHDLELFRRDCCSLTTSTEVEAGPDGSTTMRQLCESLTSGAGRATPMVVRILGLVAAVLLQVTVLR
jgi:hypothetical protein